MNYSVIIPHHNTPDLLQRCLDSIPQRQDMEVFVVDDNSSPEKVDFMHFPGLDRDDIHVIFTKEGKGAGYARNVALEKATGKWLLFFDADDFALPCFNTILDEVVDSEADIIFFRPKGVMSNDITKESKRGNSYNNIIDNYLRTGNDISLRSNWFVPWSKIIRHSLIKEYCIRFDEIRYSNDNYFSMKTGCTAKTIEVKDECYYAITAGEDTLTSSFMKKPGELECRAFAYMHGVQAIIESNYPVRDYGLSNFARRLYRVNNEMYNQYIDFIQKTFGYSRLKTYWRVFIVNYLYKKYYTIRKNLNV